MQLNQSLLTRRQGDQYIMNRKVPTNAYRKIESNNMMVGQQRVNVKLNEIQFIGLILVRGWRGFKSTRLNDGGWPDIIHTYLIIIMDLKILSTWAMLFGSFSASIATE